MEYILKSTSSGNFWKLTVLIDSSRLFSSLPAMSSSSLGASSSKTSLSIPNQKTNLLKHQNKQSPAWKFFTWDGKSEVKREKYRSCKRPGATLAIWRAVSAQQPPVVKLARQRTAKKKKKKRRKRKRNCLSVCLWSVENEIFISNRSILVIRRLEARIFSVPSFIFYIYIGLLSAQSSHRALFRIRSHLVFGY